ncbi:tRNA (adenosine(37)-N6)-threonylcarbamoyltransferase complex dimerization subunit type 1 TsaB [Sungkyunkwania multivorans]|uniref:tRNA (Adenosine(37)-N6)-threonylcarbamoyltransferase complex dimerization subunit type 1 TsaB n=1 Tax=Sungkyunkwania multivorans TaxID=1173618 RepID=A0ABW3D3E0_9FLAO
MGYILNLETATTNCSVSLAKDGKVIAIREQNDAKYSHAEKLHVFIEEVLQAASITQRELQAIAVSKGPGSYTGLRIGVSAAKGLCFALDIPLISLPTLTILASQLSLDDGLVIPLLDARRMEVYAAVFNAEGKEIRKTEAEVIDAMSFSEYLEKEKTYFIGSGAAKCKEVISHQNAIFMDDERSPSSKEMAALSYLKFLAKDFEDVAYFEPYYLKDFVAGNKR